MTLIRLVRNIFLLSALTSFGLVGLLAADESEKSAEPHRIELADGKLELTFSGDWKKVAPKNRIIEFEFSVPPVEGDEQAGRVTGMGAGGSIEDNITRWVGQFSQPDGGDTQTRTKIEELELAGQKVHVVDISGTFDDRPPFGGIKGVQREKYRMLGAIIETENLGNYFVKFYGPQATVAKNKPAFDAMVKSLKTK